MPETAVIIGNGQFPSKPYPRHLVQTADIIICCDGALETWLRVAPKLFPGEDRLPDAVVGDMDSLPGKLQQRFAGLIVAETEQEDNDQTKAFRYLMNRYKALSEVHFIGSTGKREDHTVGNMSLLMEYAVSFKGNPCGMPSPGGVYVDMVSDESTIFAVTDSCELHVGQGRKVSVFSPDNSLTIKSEGLRWPTGGVVFDNWWKATLNVAEADTVRLSFSHPSKALIVLD